MGNAYLEGNYARVRAEQTVTELAVTGAIPEHLDGRYLRNGPNPVSEIDDAAYNWFTGDAMVHGVRIRDGQAEWYRNRWVRNPPVAAALGQEPRKPRRGVGMESFGANTNVLGHAGRTLALVEGGVANYELTDELDTVGPCDFDGTLPGGYSAHPKRDPETGELHAVTYFFGWGNRVRYSVIDVHGRARRTVDVEVAGSPMMHDFSLTENYVVFYDLPVTFDARQATAVSVPKALRMPARLVLSALIGKVRIPDPVTALTNRLLPANSPLPYSWDAMYPARIGVMPREGSAADVRWFDIEPCYVFHTLNAYENESGEIVIDHARHPKMFATDLRGPNEGPPTLYRWTVDLTAGKVRDECLDDRPQEFPRFDERLLGKPHRYGYSMVVSGADAHGPAVLKHDLSGGHTVTHEFGGCRQAGEFVFVPHSEASPEDDGTLMGFVYDPTTARSELVMVDAATMEHVATVHLPSRIPNGFHGNWVPAGA